MPTTRGVKFTEIHNKKKEYLGALAFDERRRWQRFVLVDLHQEMQMSKECIDQALQLTEEYWQHDIGTITDC